MNIQQINQEKWTCLVCSFDNHFELTDCEICQTPHMQIMNHDINFIQQKKPQGEGIICRNKLCQYLNALDAVDCLVCLSNLYLQQMANQIKRETQLKHCKKCAFENHRDNQFCLNCDFKLTGKIIPENTGPFGIARKKGNLFSTKPTKFFCEKCGNEMQFELQSMHHYPTAYYSKILNQDSYFCSKCERIDSNQFYLCTFCDTKIKNQSYMKEIHNSQCQQRLLFFDSNKNKSFDRCSPLQIQTIFYMNKKYETLHQQKHLLLLRKIKKLGFNEKDLQNLQHYIINYAPIIIHMSVNRHFQFFVKDTHYRNYFQVHKHVIHHGGRVEWQDRMFDTKHHEATPFQRVKYGTMNFTNDPKGVRSCQGYGQSYFLLKQHVRNRCTITNMDSASPNALIGTFRFINHILASLSDNQLKAAFEGSKGKQMLSNVILAYKEIQIHGPVQFDKDIERVYICKDELKIQPDKSMELVKKFCVRNKLEYELFQNNLEHHKYFGFGGLNTIKVQNAPERVVKDGQQINQKEFIQQIKKEAHNGIPLFGLVANGKKLKHKPIIKKEGNKK